MTGHHADLLRSRLDRREWVVTVEAVTPAPDDDATRARILTLAGAVRADDRVAALTLTDRTAHADANPVAFAPAVMTPAAAAPLIHLAGKGREVDGVEFALHRCHEIGIGSVLLTSGDATVSQAAGPDALAMLRLAHMTTPDLTPLAVLARVHDAAAWDRAVAKRDAGAAGFIAQVSWDLVERETGAAWQARLGVPVIGAVMLLTRGRLAFLAAHGITGISVLPAIRARVVGEGVVRAQRRLALDLVMLRRLGYAGAHVSGVLTPALLAGTLDEADRLEAALGDDWRSEWRDAVGIA